MNEDHCSFSEPLLNSGFACSCATPVARRAGPDIACLSPATSKQCAALLEAFKLVGLPALGCEDDLLTMPHSVLMKVKAGGLLGLQKLMSKADAQTVDDIANLVDAAVKAFDDISSIPSEELVQAMKTQSMRRRSARRNSL